MHMHTEIRLFVMGVVSCLHGESISELWHSNDSQCLPFLTSSAQGESGAELLAWCSSKVVWDGPECPRAASPVGTIQLWSCPAAFLTPELQLPNSILRPAGFLYPLL